MVAPEWEVLGGGGIDVPGLENDEYWAERVEMKIVLGSFLMNMLKVLRHLCRAANMITAPLKEILIYLHAIIRRHDRIVGVYQRALAASDGDCRLQVAALSAWT